MDITGYLQLDHSSPADLVVVGAVIVISCLLSCDNAVVMALLVRELPRELQTKALGYGIIGAYAFRIAALVLATWIMGIWYLKVAGGAYLLYLAIAHFLRPQTDQTRPVRKLFGLNAFWSTVVAVEIADVAFSVDSIAASIALSDKLWILILGSTIGIVVMRYAAQGVVRLLERFPRLEAAAFVAIGVIGLQLLLELPIDVLRPSRPLPVGTIYATAGEYRAAVEAFIHRPLAIGSVLVVNIVAPEQPSLAIMRDEWLRRESARGIDSGSGSGSDAQPGAGDPPAEIQLRAEHQARRAYNEALSDWNLHYRPFLDFESWFSSLLVMTVFAVGFIRPARRIRTGANDETGSAP